MKNKTRLLTKCKMIILLILIMIVNSCKKPDKNGVECCLYGVYDDYFKNHDLLNITGKYPRRIELYLKIFNHSEKSAYVPIKSHFDSVYCSQLIVSYHNKVLHTNAYTSIKDRIINFKDTMHVRLTIWEDELKTIGQNNTTDISCLIDKFDIKYSICMSDTLHSNLTIDNILITRKERILYEFRDENSIYEQE